MTRADNDCSQVQWKWIHRADEDINLKPLFKRTCMKKWMHLFRMHWTFLDSLEMSKFLEIRKFGKITSYNFQSRRQIMSASRPNLSDLRQWLHRTPLSLLFSKCLVFTLSDLICQNGYFISARSSFCHPDLLPAPLFQITPVLNNNMETMLVEVWDHILTT